MNLYFLVEGKTEKKVYPAWLKYLTPHLTKISNASEVKENNYYIISGMGYPSLLDNHLINAVEEVNELGKYDYLVISLDADDCKVEDRVAEVNNKISQKKVQLKNCQLWIIVQNRCIETWFMGNSNVFTRNPSPNFTPFSTHYDVSTNDPEYMEKPKHFSGTIGQYHKKYLTHMLKEKNVNYSETLPQAVTESHYIEQLQLRVKKQPTHLKTLQNFFQLLEITA